MADVDQALLDLQRDFNARTTADLMFCRVGIALLMGELARQQPDQARAREFLLEKKKFFEDLAGAFPIPEGPFGDVFSERFREDVNSLFRSILVDPPAE